MQRINMGTFTLRFDDRDIERRFRENYWTSVLPFARFCCAWGIVLWTMFGALDPFVTGESLRTIWKIRLFVALPIAVTLFTCSAFIAGNPKTKVVLMSLVYFVGGVGIAAMIVALDPPTSHSYYAGIMLILFGWLIFSQIRFAPATLGALSIIAVYECVAIIFEATPPEVLISNNFFLIASAYIGMIASYVIERYRRLDFLQSTQLAELGAQLEELSAHDPLTGLHNRRLLSDHLHDAVEQHRQRSTPASIMLIDLDDFKGINDRFGHLAGDELLKRTARLILDFLRKTDRAYRYGGDEFLVLLPNTSLSEAKSLADRLVSRLGSHTHESTHFVTVCGISVGVASLDVSTRDADGFLIAADRALYAAKQQGKGCVVAAGGTS